MVASNRSAVRAKVYVLRIRASAIGIDMVVVTSCHVRLADEVQVYPDQRWILAVII